MPWLWIIFNCTMYSNNEYIIVRFYVFPKFSTNIFLKGIKCQTLPT